MFSAKDHRRPTMCVDDDVQELLDDLDNLDDPHRAQEKCVRAASISDQKSVFVLFTPRGLRD